MGLYDFNPQDAINANERFKISPKLEPVVDEAVSKAAGKKIFIHDPRLIKLVVKWKKQSVNRGEFQPDNFLQDPKKIAELKQVLNEEGF